MTQENKELLLKDLCARLPYGVKVYNEPYTFDLDNFKVSSTISKTIIEIIKEGWKPYLRPMSSMTDEELHEYNMHLLGINTGVDAMNFMIWIYQRHLDILHFIEKGLAIEVTEENNPYKE